MNDITQQGQLADIARDYYLGQLTITQLSEKYQLSRYLNYQGHLNEARAAGIVRITINSPIDRNTELETHFCGALSAYQHDDHQRRRHDQR